MENKSIEELEQERIILELRLLRLNKEITKRKASLKKQLQLKDRSGVQISIGDRVQLLTQSSRSSPFRGVKEAVVLGTAHKGTRVKIGLISDPSIYTDRVSTNLQVIQDGVKEEASSGEETRHTSNKKKDKQDE